MPSLRDTLRPRLCLLEKGDNGYGFHLHGEKGKTGQFIRLVEPDSPAEVSGLRAGDRLVFVNGENVENESHQQVVSRIRATAGSLELVVVDMDTEQLLRKHELKCLREYVTEGIPVADWELESEAAEVNGGARESTPELVQNGGVKHSPVEERVSSASSEQDYKDELRPRLCVIQKGSNGYGFNLHSEKTRPGQYIRAVDDDSPAEKAGLFPKDRIIQVNGVSVEGKTHSEVVAAIRAGGDKTTLLVVDPDADEFFKKCRVTPSPEHISGLLPEPFVNGNREEEQVNGKIDRAVELKETRVSVSPSPSNASSNTSLTIPPTDTPPLETVEPSIMDAIPALNLSLQQVKERAHQKRSNKRAPAMDWNKKHELFSKM
ncbi:Na(+)/H(+) exchange regulatory cofactor NHE-RF1 isoform X1 [Astyanax mexicanus]|uniref:Na(+)/H(+) exchange regulatory cofactor NHE-RF1 isoform X1 n=1 Tax=Astyanax mexicanus TaxID=7994 RepID=UPI0020CADBCD|nr:Na(+)/H(+) exchange regulatory cofactor NHE-RF1 isoform X1 [Astyanax mexicanus]